MSDSSFINSIASMSMGMKAEDVQTQLSVAVMKQIKDQEKSPIGDDDQINGVDSFRRSPGWLHGECNRLDFSLFNRSSQIEL